MADTEVRREAVQRRLLGWGLSCPLIFPGTDIGRDLQIVNGDFEQVSGTANLEQDLQVALTTLLGSDLFNVGFGFDGLRAIAEETNYLLIRERVRIAMIQVLKRDNRIARILDVKIEDGRGQLDRPIMNSTDAPLGVRQLDVHVTFETISGDETQLGITKVTTHG
jgi:hypothetical protein